MIPNRDYYADRNGKLTEDPAEYAQQVGVKGCFLDERVAKRFGITDTLVSVDEPHALRRVTGRSEPSVRIKRAEEKPQEPQEPAVVAEPKANKAAKKGEKTK